MVPCHSCRSYVWCFVIGGRGGGNHMGGNNYGRELTILDTMRY